MITDKGYVIPDAVTADVVLFTEDARIVLIRRGKDPFAGKLALPGGHLDEREKSVLAAVRELEEETGIKLRVDDMFLVGVFDDPDRDPRGWYIDHAYVAVIPEEKLSEIKAGDDAVEVVIVTVEEALTGGVELAFDHREIILEATKIVDMEFEESCNFDKVSSEVFMTFEEK